MFLRKSVFIVFLFTTLGCTSWLTRQSCKGINWFEYGHSVAMSGRRLTGDAQVQKCREAEFEIPYKQLDSGFKQGMEKYCQPKVVYSLGKSGELFNPELCDPGQVRALKEEHQRGLEAYCAPDNGYTAGASGKKYQNICPQKSEAAFLKEYRRGRKAYLMGKVTEADNNLLGIERSILDLERQRNGVGWQLNSIPPPYRNQKPEDDPNRYERDRLKSQLNSIESDIRQKQNEKESLYKQKGEYQAELATLQE